jgi:serine/threonine protein phosphatase PrpC
MHLISAEASQQHPGRHQLTRSVGSSPFLRVDLVKEKTKPRDSYLLCSDGLWSEVADNDVKKALSEKDIDNSLEELVGKVLKAGAPDNITGILFHINDHNETAS